MRSKELNYAVRGYPVGFKAPPSYTGLKNDEFYLYNHLKFTVTYREDANQFNGVRITGFDVHPVSIEHQIEGGDEITPSTKVATCNADGAPEVVNDPATYLALRTGPTGDSLKVLYSYEVEWVPSDLPWSDRWDVYLIGSPDDDIHYFAIVNSLMVVLFLTGAIATIMIRTLRKDISGYNEMQTLEEAQEETGWKLVHGDVFRPPQWHPMLLSVLVGTGAQIGCAFSLSILCAIFKLLNPMNKGQTLTAILVLYVLSGSVAGYVSARIYKFCNAKAWKQNTILTATALTRSLGGHVYGLELVFEHCRCRHGRVLPHHCGTLFALDMRVGSTRLYWFLLWTACGKSTSANQDESDCSCRPRSAVACAASRHHVSGRHFALWQCLY
jgi:transmembrane 9 superfamily protein 2/4